MQNSISFFEPIDENDSDFKRKSVRGNRLVIFLLVLFISTLVLAFFLFLSWIVKEGPFLTLLLIHEDFQAVPLDSNTYELVKTINEQQIFLVNKPTAMTAQVILRLDHDAKASKAAVFATKQNKWQKFEDYVSKEGGEITVEHNYSYSLISVELPIDKSNSAPMVAKKLMDINKVAYFPIDRVNVRKSLLTVVSELSVTEVKDSLENLHKTNTKQPEPTTKNASFATAPDFVLPKSNLSWEINKHDSITFEFPIKTESCFSKEIEFIETLLNRKLTVGVSHNFQQTFRVVEISTNWQRANTVIITLKASVNKKYATSLTSVLKILLEEFYSQANFSANDLESFEIIRKTRNLVENPDYMHLIYKGTVDKIDIIRQIDSVSVEKVFDQLAFDNLFITFSTREENFDKTATKTDFETYARQKKSPISLDVHDFARLDREINDEVKGDCTTDQIEFLNSSTDYCQLNCKKIRKLAAQIELYSLVNEFKGDYFVFSNLVLSLVQNDTIYAKEVGEKVVINFDHIKTNVRLFGNTENVLYFVSRFVDSMQKVVKGNVNEKDLRHVKQVIISDMLHDINDNSTKIDQVTLESLNELANNIDQRAGFRLKLIGSLTDEEKEEVQLLTDEIKFTKPYLISHSVDLELSNEEAEVVYLLTSDHFNGLVNLTSDERGFLVVEGETRALEKFLDSIADLNDNKLNKEKELKKKRKEKILKSFNFATENEFKTNGLIFKERRKVFVRTLGIESKGVKQKEKSLKEKLQDLKIEHHEKLLKTI